TKDKKSLLTYERQKKKTPECIVKDPYILEFLGLGEDNVYTEKELEKKIIDYLQKFLLELGQGFSFVSRQKRMR
ncbi:MAG: PDDEXK nuclease domain-containing protein, partial [Nitrospirota bacterium]